MKLFLKASVLLGFLLVTLNVSAQSKAEIQQFKKVINNLMDGWTLVEDMDYYDAAYTWIPEVGVRGKYYSNKKTLSIKIAAQLVGAPVFVSGPHGEDINYNGDGFGYYNPKFLKRLTKMLKVTSKDKDFVAKAQQFYDNVFKSYLRTYYDAYQYVLVEDKANTKKHLELLGTAAELDFQEYYRDWGTKMDRASKADWYEANTCCYFWLRRSKDNTAKQFYKVLKLTLKTFDPSYLK